MDTVKSEHGLVSDQNVVRSGPFLYTVCMLFQFLCELTPGAN